MLGGQAGPATPPHYAAVTYPCVLLPCVLPPVMILEPSVYAGQRAGKNAGELPPTPKGPAPRPRGGAATNKAIFIVSILQTCVVR